MEINNCIPRSVELIQKKSEKTRGRNLKLVKKGRKYLEDKKKIEKKR